MATPLDRDTAVERVDDGRYVAAARTLAPMSIGVELQRLHEEVARFGSSPYLLTVSDDGRPHATAVTISWDGDALVAGVGRRSASNALARPEVSLLWPPIDADGFSLIVDGAAEVDGEKVKVRPDAAVLHRQRADGPGSDCVRLDG